MSKSVFFSWQSDTPSNSGRNFIEQCLHRAISAINSEIQIQDADRPDSSTLEIDKDTKGIPGSPSIVETILGKIDSALCFVADLTFVAKRSNEGGVPNPNVMIEYGYSLRALGEKRVISVMNEAYGTPSKDNMPFDLAHKRFPITFNIPADATPADRNAQLAKLSKTLEAALRNVVDHHTSSQPEVVPRSFPAKAPPTGQARFRPAISNVDKKTLVGRTESTFGSKSRRLILDDGPAMYLRVLPTLPQKSEWTIPELKSNDHGPNGMLLVPFQGVTSRFNAEDGCGCYTARSADTDPIESDSVVIAFNTGEIWSVDTSWLRWWEERIWLGPVVQMFSQKLADYSSYLKALGIEPPFKWIAGFEDIEDRLLDWEAPTGRIRVPGYEFPCLSAGIEVSGFYSPGDSARDALRPFFVTLCNKCAVKVPEHLIPSVDPK